MSKIDPQKLERIKGLLEDEESFPLIYNFKFIVPTAKLTEILSLFPKEEDISTKTSKKGSYISVTIKKNVETAQRIIDIYESVSVIDGVISL